MDLLLPQHPVLHTWFADDILEDLNVLALQFVLLLLPLSQSLFTPGSFCFPPFTISNAMELLTTPSKRQKINSKVTRNTYVHPAYALKLSFYLIPPTENITVEEFGA